MRCVRAWDMVATTAAIAGLAAAAIWSVRVGWADLLARQETVDATERAAGFAPGQAAYYLRLAILTAETNPAGSMAALRRGVALNPSDAALWIEWGLRLEAEGKVEQAAECLLKAAEVDRQYLPRWSLANFYFRHNDAVKFRFWAKASAEMVYGDATPLFRLCGQAGEDGDLIERIAIARPDVRANYLSYLMNSGGADLIVPAARKVLENNRESDVPVLMEACDRLLLEQRPEGAQEIWNGLAERRRIPFGVVGGPGPALTNGDFATAPTSHGFDWRIPTVEGVSASGEEGPGGLRLRFSGGQPENCEVLTQLVSVRPGSAYELSFVYRTSGIPPHTGLRWRVQDASSGGALGQSESLSSEAGEQGAVRLRTPGGCKLVRISLAYQRLPGTGRITGFVTLRGLAMNRQN